MAEIKTAGGEGLNTLTSSTKNTNTVTMRLAIRGAFAWDRKPKRKVMQADERVTQNKVKYGRVQFNSWK